VVGLEFTHIAQREGRWCIVDIRGKHGRVGSFAIRKLAAEAAYNGLMDASAAQAVRDVRGAKTQGTRTGNWLIKSTAPTSAPSRPPRSRDRGSGHRHR
jgi:hypothetical protein